MLAGIAATSLIAFGVGVQPTMASNGHGGGASSNSYSGEAYDLYANLMTPLGQVVVGPVTHAGPLASTTPFAVDQSLLSFTTPPNAAISAKVDVLESSAVGSGNESDSFASVANASLVLGSPPALTITAAVLQSEASAKCSNGVASASGGSVLAQLVINGTPITIAAPPNQTITVPGVATITLNEQTPSSTGSNEAAIDVNAVHVHLLQPVSDLISGDVIVSHSHADITCAPSGKKPPPPPPCGVKDFVTGGGYITTPSGGKGTFGFVGFDNLKGHLEYMDHGTSQRIEGSGLTSYSGSGNSRKLVYSSSGGPVSVDVTDNGNPGSGGAGVDDFAVSQGTYSASGSPIDHGNIHIHHVSGC